MSLICVYGLLLHRIKHHNSGYTAVEDSIILVFERYKFSFAWGIILEIERIDIASTVYLAVGRAHYYQNSIKLKGINLMESLTWV